MKLHNKSGNGLQHVLIVEGKTMTYTLANDATADIPEEIAEKWLKIQGVEKYIAPVDLEKAANEAKAKAETEKKALEEENAKLEAKIVELEKAVKEAEEKAKLEALKAEADSLNIEYPANIGAAKLQGKIDKAKEQK